MTRANNTCEKKITKTGGHVGESEIDRLAQKFDCHSIPPTGHRSSKAAAHAHDDKDKLEDIVDCPADDWMAHWWE